MSGVRKAQWCTFDENFYNLCSLSYKVKQVNIYSIVDMWITIRYYDRHYEQSLEARTNLNDEMMVIRCQIAILWIFIIWSMRVRRWYAYGNAQICVVTAARNVKSYFPDIECWETIRRENVWGDRHDIFLNLHSLHCNLFELCRGIINCHAISAVQCRGPWQIPIQISEF